MRSGFLEMVLGGKCSASVTERDPNTFINHAASENIDGFQVFRLMGVIKEMRNEAFSFTDEEIRDRLKKGIYIEVL